MMAERSCGKVDTKCRDCGHNIKRCKSFSDNFCDNCDETIELSTSEKNYFNVKKINILSGLLVDRKNKFILVGDGKCSFTVAFNAYRQFLWDKYDDSLLTGVFNQQHFRNYAYSPRLIIAMLIQLHEYRITEEVIKTLRDLLIPTHQICISAHKLAKNAVECLNASNLKLEEAISCRTELNNMLKHLFISIQELNSANKYLLQSIREVKTQKCKIYCQYSQEIIKTLQESYEKVNQATKKLSSSDYCDCETLHIFFDRLEESNIENKHVMSLVIVDDMAQDIAGCVTRPPMDIISYRYDDVKMETINGKKEITQCNSDSYDCPSEEVVEMLRDIDCTNIHQMWGSSALSIPPNLARWSNLIWFQCTYPWIKQEEVECAIVNLIRDFLLNASYNCAPGTYVCVGITLHPDYIHKYHLERILEDRCILDQYEFLGVDDVLINKLLSYGYKHDSKDIHVTLVFKLKNIYNSYYRRWTQLCIKYKSDTQID